MEEIWNNVLPWPIQEVALASAEELQSQHILTLSTPEALHQLLLTRTSEQSPEMTHVEACVPSFKIKYSQKEDEEEERQRILVMACCCNIGDEHMKIGHMLEHCYKFGVLEQPVDKESEAYLDHICLLVECWSLLNRVSYISQVLFDDECLRYRLTVWGKIKAILARGNSKEKIFGIELVDLLRILHLLNPVLAPLDSSPGPTLRVDDLNILSLRTLGKAAYQVDLNPRKSLVFRSRKHEFIECLEPPP